LPKKDHPTLGDVQQHVYLRATIQAVYLNNPLVEERLWDTADIELYEGGTYLACPILYHCSPWKQLRGNGSVETGGRAFVAGDQVFVLAKKAEEKIMEDGCQKFYSEVTVLGFVNGPKKCAYNYALVRISKNDLLPLEPPFGTTSYVPEADIWSYTANDPDSHKDELCILYDYHTQGYAEVRVAWDSYESTVEFPCTVEYLKPFLDEVELRGVELFDFFPQGNIEDDTEKGFPYATGAVNWKSDDSGEDLGVNTFGCGTNKVQQMFQDLRSAFTSDTEGLVSGEFTTLEKKLGEYWDADEEGSKICEWASKSEGFSYEAKSGIAVPGTDEAKSTGIADKSDDLQAAIYNYIRELQREIDTVQARIEEIGLQQTYYQELVETLSESISNEMDVLEEAKELYRKLENAGWWGYVLEQVSDQINALTNDIEEKQATVLRIEETILPELTLENERLAESIKKKNEQIEAAEKGEVPFSYTQAYLPDGSLAYNNSFHLVTGYGENEIWVCAKNTYQGMVVSYCDAMWKFVQWTTISDVLSVPNEAIKRLHTYAGLGTVAPGTASATSSIMIANLSIAVAADITISASGGSGIFSYALLKRVYEGLYHRSSFPCDREYSFLAVTRPIPEDEAQEPQYKTAINTRREVVQVWDRYDNWQNTMGFSYAVLGVDRSWWWRSEGQEWLWECRFLDTPIGSLMLEPPRFSAGIWYMYQIQSPISIYRHDSKVFCEHREISLQSSKMCLQIYVVQRSAISLWAETETGFVKQELTKGPYTSKFERDGVEGVSYVNVDGEMVLYKDLDDEAKADLLEKRFYVSAVDEDGNAYSDMRGSLQNNRNEIEVLAGFESWNRMYFDTQRRCPRDQKRNASFEQKINELIMAFYVEQEKSDDVFPSTLVDFNLGAEII
jgi:hypothetical protein